MSDAHYRRSSTSAPAHFSGPEDEPKLAYSRWLADLAEAGGCAFDEESTAYAHSFAGVGYTEHIMALEG